MTAAPDRVTIWRSQLKTGDVPPVCVISGAPAEAWFKVRYVTAPAWAWALLVLLVTGIGLIPIFVIMRLVSRSADGVLPTTLAIKRRMRNASLIGWGAAASFIFFPIVGGIVGGAFDTADDSTPALFGLLAGLAVGLAMVAWAVWTNVQVGRPKGRVDEVKGQADYLVELRGLNPAFVSAVNAMHAARASQLAAPPVEPPAQRP